MIRFLFGAMAVVAVYLGWQWYSTDRSADPTDGVFERADAPMAARQPLPEEGSGPAATTAAVPKESDSPVVEALAKGDPKALNSAFQRLREAEGAEHERLSTLR